MLYMNESEIDSNINIIHAYCPGFLPYAIYLQDFRDIVNANSDGWAYWAPPLRAAKKLMELLQQAERSIREQAQLPRTPMPTHAQFRKALTPIKSLATRKGLPAPTLKVKD